MPTPQDLPSFLRLDNLIIKPPTTTNSILNFPPATIAADAKSTHIIVHPRYPALLTSFLAHKRANGSIHERSLYANLSWQQLASRFINARPLTFMGASDLTLLRDGTMLSSDANEEWDRNGTASQNLNSYLTLEDYLSYDEIMLSSLLGVSSPSQFINTGSRWNRARPAPKDSHEPRGIIVGLVGARFERENRMDSVHILPPTEEANSTLQDPAITTMIQTFLGAPRNQDLDFDIPMYKARCRITAEMFLLEANARAAEAGQKAWAYVVGLGLGVWQHAPEQREWYISAWGEALDALDLPQVGTVEFAYINGVSAQVEEEISDVAARKGLRVVFSRRDPAEKLQGGGGGGGGDLLVLSYAWDGNAFPGNEFWLGSLDGSGDPAAACMSTVAELHNPLVNPEFVERIKVAGTEGYA